jgi:antitoxin component YwqK of YwqJK toxin-antitoxin module
MSQMNKTPLEQLAYDDGVYRWQGRLFTGAAVEKSEDGTVIGESQYKHGVRDGPTRVWYENGKLKSEAHYKMGRANGLKQEWFPDGRLKVLKRIELGTLVEEEEWDRQGNLIKSFHIDEKGPQFKLLEKERMDENHRVRRLLAELGVSEEPDTG